MALAIGTVGNDNLIGTEADDDLQGLSGSDILIGLAGDDGLKGGPGADVLDAGAGNDELEGGTGADLLRGGGDFDVARYKSANARVTASLSNPASNTGDARGDKYSSIEALQGSDFNDTLIGNGLGNVLIGGKGGDLLNGRGGFDFARYNLGDVTRGVTANLADPSLNTGVAKGDRYISIEGIIGTNFSDRLFGNSAANILAGGKGADLLDGGDGFDFATYNISGVKTGVTASLADPARNKGEAAGDRYSSIEGLIGTKFNDGLVGNGGANVLEGGRGADNLFTGGADGALDVLRYTSLSDSRVTATTRDDVFGFVHGQDKIDLRGIDADPLRAGNQAFHVVSALTSARAEVHLLRSGADTLVRVDGDVEPSPDMIIRVVGAHLTADDIIL